jgi:ribosome maturation protein SDO1
MSREYTLVRHQVENEKFEILVDPEKGLSFKRGEIEDVANALIIDTIYTDSSKGEKASGDKLEKAYGTSDPLKVAQIMFEKGIFQLTSQQRKDMLDQKKKQIINIISRTYVDPSSKLPHPVIRIENALESSSVNIDPFKPADEQVGEIVKALRPILPMSSENIRIAIKIPPESTGKSYGIVKNYGEIKREEWQNDGSWIAVVELPAARQLELLQALGKATQGNVESKIM